MQVFNNLESYLKIEGGRSQKIALTIGNFEGLHLGHRELISRLVAGARQSGALPALITFEPHPLQFFKPQLGPLRITSAMEESRLLSEWGIAVCFHLKFDQRMSNLSAEEFMKMLTVLPIESVFVGDDFSFGKSKTGGFKDLLRFFSTQQVKCNQMDSFLLEGKRVSSSLIRQELSFANYELASKYLGRPYALEGEVVRGESRGRTIGFPTANVDVSQFFLPKLGVSACRVWVGKRHFLAVTNLGVRPTFHQDKQANLEIHLLGFSEDIYGQNIRVEFVKYLRPEMKFDGIEQLKAQIRKDILAAKVALNEKKDS